VSQDLFRFLKRGGRVIERFPHAAEGLTCFKQFISRPFSDFHASFNVDNFVGVLDCGEAVRDQNLGDFAMQVGDGFFDVELANGI
jgi:hypothetical protein